MVAGKLRVQVVNAAKLKNKERFQKSDPYCMVECGQEAHKTKAIDNNLSPEWNESFVFSVADGVETLALSIWDKNTLTKDNFMGFTYASFTDCPKDKETKKVIQIIFNIETALFSFALLFKVLWKRNL